jgi:hypothetical protein
MAAGSVCASGQTEWRMETPEPPKIVRKYISPHHAVKKTDRQIAESVFHTPRIPQTVKLISRPR